MTTADLAHVISEAVQGSVWSFSTGKEEVASPASSVNEDQAGWQRVLELLSAWDGKQSLRDEDGIEWPAPAVVELARRLAISLQRQKFRPPTRLVPNGEGGIVFECQQERDLQTIEIEADGAIELCRFNDAKLTDRRRIPLASND